MYSIIGGGIGGLTTALAFEKLGIAYQLFEKSEVLVPIGSGILLPPNALQVYEWLGLLDDLMAKGNAMKRITLTKPDMSPLFDYVQDDVKEKYGYYALSIHRWELQNCLLQRIPAHKIHLGKSFKHFEHRNHKVQVSFEDGTSIETNFLIGADGIHSKIRKQLFPKSKIRYSGQSCWRGICTSKALHEAYQHRGIEMWGQQLRFGITKIEAHKFYWFAVQLSPPGLKDTPGKLQEKLAAYFADFHPMVNELIYGSLEENIIRSDLYDVKPLKEWYRGSVCLIGDAAHATTPNMGQGGAQAIEDAYYLANAIVNAPNNAFKNFQAQRKQKVDQIVKQSRMMGKMGHWKYGVWPRNYILKNTPRSIFKRNWSAIYQLK
ncbi:FAD-dependent monooxygenase [Spongiimicrobium salis]|uniref:FAD-dependent monooxygenase n=1 Tax=Spongiimicrobium salis TaxID=1667022 RepID=UPI00374D0C97